MVKLPSSRRPVVEFLRSYIALPKQAELHDELGTQRSDEPVSKSMINWALAEPIVIKPVHSVSSFSSTKRSPWRFPRWESCGWVRLRVLRGMIQAPRGNALAPAFFLRLMRLLRCLLQNTEYMSTMDHYCIICEAGSLFGAVCLGEHRVMVELPPWIDCSSALGKGDSYPSFRGGSRFARGCEDETKKENEG